ncbi:ferredoxin [Micromonospora sp. MH33]|uniref:ferredoxin n=1 Tax=Micromonospora sp. MH33 TaxID=1945509 RepID=UPI000D14BB63|nr:ferredoxin [Micromonospora sp. MH33]
MRVGVDRDRCCGAGNCVVTAPEVFDQDDEDGLVLLRRAEPPADTVDRVRLAVELCPAGAISVAPAGAGALLDGRVPAAGDPATP